MNPLIQWLIKEHYLFMQELPRFLNYYTLRDRIPFYAFLIYLLGKDNANSTLKFLSEAFLVSAFTIAARTIYYAINGISDSIFKGFKWINIVPIQYVILIFVLTLIGYSSTKNINYSTALGYNGASAIGYLYETPFWLFSQKYDEAHFLHASHRFIFYLDYQLISIFVFLWLLKQQKTTLTKKDLIGFGIAWGITFIMASQMYVWETNAIARLPIMVYTLFLTIKIKNHNNTNGCSSKSIERCRKLGNECEVCVRGSPNNV